MYIYVPTYVRVKGHLTNIDMPITDTEKNQVATVTDYGLSKAKSYHFKM